MMVTTSFLSMWLSNTASTAMMLPIASAILKSLFGQRDARKDLPREGEDSTGEAGWVPGPIPLPGMGTGGLEATGEDQGHTHVLDTRCGLSAVMMTVN